MISRRQLLTGLASTTALTALPYKATPQGIRIYQRGIGGHMTYTANDPRVLLNTLWGTPGYSPTLDSVTTWLKQPVASARRAPYTDPFQAAHWYVQQPWFHGLGSLAPLTNPPPPSITRGDRWFWTDSNPTSGFHPVFYPVKRGYLWKEKARRPFRKRAKLQTERIYHALKRRAPKHLTKSQLARVPWNDPSNELAQGMWTLISRSAATDWVLVSDARDYRLVTPATAYAQITEDEFGPTGPFGAIVPPSETFTGPQGCINATGAQLGTALGLLGASAAFAAAAQTLGVNTAQTINAAIASIGVSTFGVISYGGLALAGVIGTATLVALGIGALFFVVACKIKPDGTLDITTQIAPFGGATSPIGGSPTCTACRNPEDPNAATAGALVVIPDLTLSLTLSPTLSLTPSPDFGPVATPTSDDGGPAPSDDGSDGVSSDGGDAGDW